VLARYAQHLREWARWMETDYLSTYGDVVDYSLFVEGGMLRSVRDRVTTRALYGYILAEYMERP